MSREKAKALKGMDASDLIKAKFKAVLPAMSVPQLDQVQRMLDAYVINADVDQRYEEADRKSRKGWVVERHDYLRDPVLEAKAKKVLQEKIALKEANTFIRLDFEKLLTPDALAPTSDNPDEASYLLRVKAELAKQGIWLNIFRDSSQIGRTQYSAANDHRGWIAQLFFGGDKRTEIKTETGQLTRKDLFSIPLFKIGKYDYVHNGPTLRLLKAAINSVSSKVRVMVALHHDYAPKSLRGKVLDWGTREAARMGGVSVECPDEKIWDEPAQLLTKALDLINHGKLGEANKLIILATYQAEWCANAVVQYVNFVEAVKPGVKVGLRILQVAEALGKIADAILFLRAAGKGVVRLLTSKPSPPALPAPGTSSPSRQLPAPSTSSPSRQLPAAGQSSASNPVEEVYQEAIKKAENAVQPASRSAPSIQSVAPSNGKVGTISSPSDVPRDARSATGVLEAQERWDTSRGRIYYLQDLRHKTEYVRIEISHLMKVNPNATMAEKRAIMDRADRIWTGWDETGTIPVKYRGE